MLKRIIFVVLLIVLVGLGFFFIKADTHAPSQGRTKVTPPSAQHSEEKTISITELDMEMTIPKGFTFSKEQQMNMTTHEPYAVSFIIQNYKDNPTQVTNPYQLYGMSQWDTAETTVEEFSQADFMLLASTRETFMVDGLPAIKGVAAGERGRYTIYILKDGHTIALAADGSSEEHKKITDEIVKTIRFK